MRRRMDRPASGSMDKLYHRKRKTEISYTKNRRNRRKEGIGIDRPTEILVEIGLPQSHWL